MLDGYSEKSLLKFLIIESNSIIFMILFVFSKLSEYLCNILTTDDEWIQLKNKIKIMPGLINYFVVVFPLSNWKIAGLQQKIKESSSWRLECVEDILYRLRIIEFVDFLHHFLFGLNSFLITLVNLTSEFFNEILLLFTLLLFFLHLFLLFFTFFLQLFFKFINLLLVEALEFNFLLFFLLFLILFLFFLFKFLLFLLFLLLLQFLFLFLKIFFFVLLHFLLFGKLLLLFLLPLFFCLLLLFFLFQDKIFLHLLQFVFALKPFLLFLYLHKLIFFHLFLLLLQVVV